MDAREPEHSQGLREAAAQYVHAAMSCLLGLVIDTERNSIRSGGDAAMSSTTIHPCPVSGRTGRVYVGYVVHACSLYADGLTQ